MIIQITEECIHEDSVNSDDTALRIVEYLAKDADSLFSAFKMYDGEDFNSDNIIYCNDDFDGGCLDSKIVSVKIIEKGWYIK